MTHNYLTRLFFFYLESTYGVGAQGAQRIHQDFLTAWGPRWGRSSNVNFNFNRFNDINCPPPPTPTPTHQKSALTSSKLLKNYFHQSGIPGLVQGTESRGPTGPSWALSR